jgi:hypothetical protein
MLARSLALVAAVPCTASFAVAEEARKSAAAAYEVTGIPLLVYDIGCEELTVTATLTVAKKKSKKTVTIPFGCGE